MCFLAGSWCLRPCFCNHVQTILSGRATSPPPDPPARGCEGTGQSQELRQRAARCVEKVTVRLAVRPAVALSGSAAAENWWRLFAPGLVVAVSRLPSGPAHLFIFSLWLRSGPPLPSVYTSLARSASCPLHFLFNFLLHRLQLLPTPALLPLLCSLWIPGELLVRGSSLATGQAPPPSRPAAGQTRYPPPPSPERNPGVMRGSREALASLLRSC